MEKITVETEDGAYSFHAARHDGVHVIHIYVKEIWWRVPTDADATAYLDALLFQHRRLEALIENGWEIKDSDGEHLYFEKAIEETDDGVNQFEVTDELN